MDIRSIAPASVETQRNRLSDAIEELIPASQRGESSDTAAARQSDRVAISPTARELAANQVHDSELSFARLALTHSGSAARAERLDGIAAQLRDGTYLSPEVADGTSRSLMDELTAHPA